LRDEALVGVSQDRSGRAVGRACARADSEIAGRRDAGDCMAGGAVCCSQPGSGGIGAGLIGRSVAPRVDVSYIIVESYLREGPLHRTAESANNGASRTCLD